MGCECTSSPLVPSAAPPTPLWLTLPCRHWCMQHAHNDTITNCAEEPGCLLATCRLQATAPLIPWATAVASNAASNRTPCLRLATHAARGSACLPPGRQARRTPLPHLLDQRANRPASPGLKPLPTHATPTCPGWLEPHSQTVLRAVACEAPLPIPPVLFCPLNTSESCRTRLQHSYDVTCRPSGGRRKHRTFVPLGLPIPVHPSIHPRHEAYQNMLLQPQLPIHGGAACHKFAHWHTVQTH